MITWVIGQGGLLGGALASRAGTGTLYEPGPIPWDDPEAAASALHGQARGLEQLTGEGSWQVIWAAGAATTSTSEMAANAELVPLEGLVSGLRSALPSGPGAFFLASSAGGVYAGSPDPPFDGLTPTHPLSPYGRLKLAQEALVSDTLATAIPVVVGRISNLYGPGQNLAKLQGLISRLALAAVTRQPINLFVPLETMRDYIHVDDAARGVLSLLVQARQEGAPTNAATHIIASGRGTTIGQLVRTMNEIAKKRVPVALGSHPSSAAQALDLRLVPSLDIPQLTPLPVGMKAVYEDILRLTQQESLAMLACRSVG